MISNDDKFAKKLTTYLDAGTAELRAGTAYRAATGAGEGAGQPGGPGAGLAESRLAHAFAGVGAQRTGGGVRRGVWLGLAVLLLAAALFGYQQWQLYQQTREIEELDAQILSSDLPIDAYLDRGFQTWLTRYQP